MRASLQKSVFFPYTFWSFNMYYHQRGVGQQDMLRYFIYLFMDDFLGAGCQQRRLIWGGPGIRMPLIPNNRGIKIVWDWKGTGFSDGLVCSSGSMLGFQFLLFCHAQFSYLIRVQRVESFLEFCVIT